MLGKSTRRRFVRSAAVGALALTELGCTTHAQEQGPMYQEMLSRWKGFNLLEKFNVGRNGPFVERDFQWMADWGFTFARLPMDYRCWTEDDDPMKLREPVLAEIDEAVEWGKQYGIHINVNFHRAPGYTVATPPEALNLWTDERAQEICELHWRTFAARYRGIPSERVSFNLFNEPARVDAETHAKVVRRIVNAIREEDPERLVVIDGIQWANQVAPGLEDLGLPQSTRGYQPMGVSHYKASWVGGENWPEPKWPGVQQDGRQWDKNTLRERLKPFAELAQNGPGAHVGEFGAYNRTPHNVALAWLRDWLDLWADANMGWALWNLRGSFGIVDSGREDVQYEPFDGDHRLDREMRDLLLETAGRGPE